MTRPELSGRLARVATAAALVAALAVTVTATPGGAAPAAHVTTTTARTAVDPAEVTVTLNSLTPVVPTPTDTLTIRGTVTNATTETVRKVDVRLRVSPTPVRTRSEISAILAGDAGRTGVSVPGARVSVSDVMEPGAVVPFTLSVPMSDLGLPRTTPEVVVIGVESVGDVDNDGQGPVQTGFTRTFLPWFPDPAAVTPTPVVWLFPLTTAPSRTSDSVFLDDHLAAEVGPKGRLSRLLDAAEAAPSAVSWVIDPALLQSLQDMTDGYVVTAPGGASATGTGGPAAQAWLDRLRTLTGSAEVTASAYADPDVVALHRAGLDVDIALAATTARDIPPRVVTAPVGGGLAWPAGKVADDGTLDVLRASGARVVVLSSGSLPPSPPVTYTPSGSVDLATGGSPLRAAVADTDVSELVAAPTRGSDPRTTNVVVRRQAALAEIAMTTLELPTTPRTLVIAPDTRWSAVGGGATRALVTALAASPWSRPERLATLVSSPPSGITRQRSDYPESARAAELSPAFLAAVGRARRALADLRSVAPDSGSTSTSGYEEALTRAESSAWRLDPARGARLLATVRGQIDAQIALVAVLSKAPVTLPGDSGVIPVTVANDLDRPARVGLRLVGTPSTRFVSADIEPVTLEPGEKATLEVTARVIGTGPVNVDITLLTPDGRVLGTPVRTEVRSTAYARAAQWVVGGLFGILVLLLFVNFVRRRRPLAVAATADRDPDDDLTMPITPVRSGDDSARSDTPDPAVGDHDHGTGRPDDAGRSGD